MEPVTRPAEPRSKTDIVSIVDDTASSVMPEKYEFIHILLHDFFDNALAKELINLKTVIKRTLLIN